MTRVGYARVSTATLDLDIQTARLAAAGCGVIRTETGSGASREGRGELRNVLLGLRVVSSISPRNVGLQLP